ncbi:MULTISPECIES: LytTR family DNA-binding domain-containing protein [unclassified Spirosoma]|uniref:LytR/AlgR family response regulator transcription factor n=1 Tax=unclassified Spirosoma TaxID=2621999 RepID=UPI000969597C|nr:MULTISPECIES: LytTR family DNA-binding domain-containing protein [unclassified Spirosoma]MBN8822419.1 response regulator transcription factor [Spirosoma sp.]OJW73718.1 MAG: DNA-binding response regulator [Spirosoma sp. 48-14]
MRCLIVDDEPLAHAVLSDYIRKVPFLELVGATTSPIDALTYVQRGEVDLVFLDIQMPELTGMQFLKLVERAVDNHTCRVILTTAYSSYALEGYEHNVVDYLLKPVSFERFYKAVQKLYSPAQSAVSVSSSISENGQHTQTESAPKDFIFIKTEYRLQRISLSDILYCEGLKDYVSIYTVTERILALQTMKSLEEKLPSIQFVRVHKSYIVALNRIESIERNRIYINQPGHAQAVVPIGETYRDAFYRLIEE